MTHFVHHVPGRLRIKSPALKRNERQAKVAEEYLDSMNGVLSAEANTVTGSLVIKYDAFLVHGETILNSLHAMGYAQSATLHRQGYSSGMGVGQKVSDTLVNKLLETVVERSAVALIAALI
ncbi:MAG: HMA2 domain-containing protein [Sulfuricella sp.]